MITTTTRARRALATIAVATVALAACGGDDDSDDGGDDTSEESGDESSGSDDEGAESGDDESSASGDGNVYGGELEDGTVLTVTFDVDPGDALVAPFADFREQAGSSDDVVWITGSLQVPADYDDATGPPTGRFLTFVEPGGDVISETNPTSTFACSLLDTWYADAGVEADDPLTDVYISTIEEACAGQTLGVVGEIGGTTEYVMVVEGTSIPDFDAVYAGLLTELQPQ